METAVKLMGEARESFMVLMKTDLPSLWGYWRLYQGLFGDERDVALMNRSAKFCFSVFQATLMRSLISGINRITDKAIYKNRKRLSLDRLLKFLDSTADKTAKEDLQKKFKAIGTTCEDLRLIRDELDAHRDEPRALGKASTPLPSVSYAVIEKVLADISAFMNEFAKACGEDVVNYAGTTIPIDGGPRALLRLLEIAEEHRPRTILD